MALDQARRRLTHPAPAEDADDHAPPLPRQTSLLVDGEVPLDQAASGRTPQPGPPTPDGSYTPHGLREGYVRKNNDSGLYWQNTDERLVSLPPIILKGGVAQPSTYAQRAEESYTEHSLGANKTKGVPLSDLPSIVGDFLTWLRDATPLLKWMQRKGWIEEDAQASIAYKIEHYDTDITLPLSSPEPLLPTMIQSEGFQTTQNLYCKVTAINLHNTADEPLVVTWVGVNGKQVYPPKSGTFLIPKDIPPGAFQRLNVEEIAVPIGIGAKIEVEISVKGENTGRWDSVKTSFSPEE